MQLKELKPGTFTVRLYFIEPKHTIAEARVFDVARQGKKVRSNFDILVAAEGKMKSVVREFSEVQVDGDCRLTCTSHKGRSLLSGIALVSPDLPLNQLREMIPGRRVASQKTPISPGRHLELNAGTGHVASDCAACCIRKTT